MVHKIVKDALNCMSQYKIEREVEKYEMVYCTGRIEANIGKNEAMTILNEHLDKHYEILVKTPIMEYRAGK